LLTPDEKRQFKMSDATIHEDNDTPKVSPAGIERCDADTTSGKGVSIAQGIGLTPTDIRKDAIQNAPKTPS